MLTAFSTALSALSADSTAVDVVGNNLANLNTVGFKASDISFQELVNQAIGSDQLPGFGVAPPTITELYTQGAIQTTGGQYDAAIQGSGFFVVKNSEGSDLYTRNGQFTTDKNGNLVDSNGDFVQGWNATNGTLNTSGAVGNVVIPTAFLSQPVPSTTFSVGLNLNAAANPDTTSDFQTSIQVIDSLGATHNLTLDFQKTGTNAWSYTVSIPSTDLSSSSSSNTLASGNVTFDSSGNLIDPSNPPTKAPVNVKITGLADGAADMNLNWNLFDPTSGQGSITQLISADGSTAGTPVVDGTQAAKIDGVAIGTNGQIVLDYAGGQPKSVAQIALANITNPETLVSAGNGLLSVSQATGLPSIGVPGTGGRGSIQGGALESSTVDIAKEFTQLIVYQRSYEANGKVVTTADQLSQDTINLKST